MSQLDCREADDGNYGSDGGIGAGWEATKAVEDKSFGSWQIDARRRESWRWWGRHLSERGGPSPDQDQDQDQGQLGANDRAKDCVPEK